MSYILDLCLCYCSFPSGREVRSLVVRKKVLEVNWLEFAQSMEVRSWSRGFIQSFIPAIWINYSCFHDVNFPSGIADTMDSICVEEGDVWGEVRRRNDGSTLPALSNLVHRSSVDQRETVPAFAGDCLILNFQTHLIAFLFPLRMSIRCCP